MSFPLTVTVTSMQTPAQFCLNNLRNNKESSSSTLLTSTTSSLLTSTPPTILSINHQHGHNHHHPHHLLQQDSRYSEDHPQQHHHHLMLGSFAAAAAASANATNHSQQNNSDNNNNNHQHQHSHYKARKMMITPSPPPLPPPPIITIGGGDEPDLVSRATPRSNNLNLQRKQSVFVAPSGLSSIREHHGSAAPPPPPTTTTATGVSTKSEDLSERIAKLIQDNEAIVEAAPNLVQTSPLFNRRSSMSSQQYHLQQQQQPIPPPPPQYPLTAPPLRRYSSSMDRSQRNQSNVIIQTGDQHHPSSRQQNSTPASVPYSKLQSALLGDSYNSIVNPHHPHHQTSFPSFAINPAPRTSGSPNYSDHQSNIHVPQLTPLHHPPINPGHLLNMRKYSEHLLPTWVNPHQNPLGFGEYLLGPTQPPAPSVVDHRNETSTSSSSILFPSLYQQHSSSSSSPMFRKESTSGGQHPLSVIINPNNGGNVRLNDQPSDPKSCLVRNLLLNSQKRFSCYDDQCCSNVIGGNGHCHIHCNDGGPNNSKAGQTKLAGLSSQTDCLHNNGGSTGSGSEKNQHSQQQSCIIKDLLLKSSSKTSLNGGVDDTTRSSTATLDHGNAQEMTTNNNNSNNNNNSLSTISESHLPPRKRSRVHNNPNSDNGNATSDTTLRNVTNVTNQSDPKQPISTHPHHVHPCELCLVSFQHEQNLEIHQQYYCSGQKMRSGQSSSSQPTVTESTGQEEARQQPQQITQQSSTSQSSNRERKVSVLERPSIITYTNSALDPKIANNPQPQQTVRYSHSDRPSMATLMDQNHRSQRCSSSSSSSAIDTGVNNGGSLKETASTKYNFGNILKSKLLAGHHHHHHQGTGLNFEGDDEDEEDDETYECLRHPKSDQKPEQQLPQSFKKRKISEPAFRYYSNPYCEATVKQHRTSVLQQKSTAPNSAISAGVNPSLFSANQNYSPLEIIPAYMPCLMRPNTKITIKGPTLLPVLQRMVDMGTNHEFIVDNNDDDYLEQNDDYGGYMKNEQTRQRFLVKQEQEILIEQEINQLMNDILSELEQTWNIGQCLSDMIDVVAQERKIVPTATIAPQRPTTLALQNDQTNTIRMIKKEPDHEDDGPYDHSQETMPKDHHRRRKVSVLVNQCSWIQNDFNAMRKRAGSNGYDNNIQQHQLIPSTLVSPDTPRPKRKYQQLFLNGNAYSNLGLKVSLRPTYCCIYRLQPMFVMQEANPQLSMYSQWTTHPIPDGDVLKLIKSPAKLLAAYNSQEAVFVHNSQRCGRKHQQPATPLVTYQESDSMGIVNVKAEPEEQESVSTASVGEFLRKIKAQFFSKPDNDDEDDDSGTNHQSDRSNTRTLSLLDRCLKSLILTNGQGLMDRVVDQSTKTNLFLTPSNYQQLTASLKQHSKSARTNQNSNHKYPQRHRLSSESSVDFSAKSMGLSSQQAETALCSSVTTTCCGETIKLDRRKRSSGLSSIYNIAPTLNSSMSNNLASRCSSVSTSSFCLNHVPMFQPESPESEQAILYIMMLSQAQPSLSVPSVEQIMSTANKNLAFRKFSDCIGLRQQNNGNNVYDQEHGWRFGGGNQDMNCDPSNASFMPKRIKIFEGGFKSNEDYTYIRGRGRGKYMCGECGIRCKKPSMLKKHIRTHTDLRPYSCRYCAFAFKTKGNLTKHMKSKAHHKKCVEMNIIPVPISIDDSQIDMDALNKQEQYELNCNDGSNGGGGVNGGHDDEYDDDEMDEEEEDDEGVPIPVMQQPNRLTYIEPGQFDDADDSNGGSVIKRKLSESAMKVSTKTTRSLSSSATIAPTIRMAPTSINAPHNTTMVSNNNDDKNNVFDPSKNSNQSIKAPIENQCTNLTISLINDNDHQLEQELPLLKTNDNRLVDENDANTVVPLASSNHHQQIIIKTSSPTSISSIKTNHMIENDPKRNLLMISSTNHPHQAQTTATTKMDPIRKSGSPLSPSSSYHNSGRSSNQPNIVPQQQSSTTNSDLKSPLLGNKTTNRTTTSSSPSSSLAKQRQDENEAEAARSLLILSSGTNPVNQQHHHGKIPHHLDGSPPVMEAIPGPRTTSTTIASGAEMVYVPEIYGHDSALLKQIFSNPSQPQSSIETMVPGKVIPTPPQLNQHYPRPQPPAPATEVHHQKSHPTSVIIANHQSSINNHQKQSHWEQPKMVDTQPTSVNHQKKRVRTISNCSNNSSGSGDYGVQPPQPLKKLTTASTSPTNINSSNTNLHSVTTMIASTSPTLVNTNAGGSHPMIMVTNHHPHLMDNNLNGAASASTQQKLLQKIYSNQQQQQQRTTAAMPIGFRTATPPIASGSKDLIVNNAPQQHPSIRIMGNSPSSSSTFCAPLPTIVEQSLSRYVANNSAAQAAAAAASTRSTDQDQPIDLSSKKSLSPAPKLLHVQSAAIETSPQQTQTSKTGCPSETSPVPESAPSPNKGIQTRTNNLIKNYDHRLSEQIVRQFSGFDNTAVGFAPLLMGDNQPKDLYQSIRSEEFAHSMPGVRTPHSISKTIPHVWMVNNNHQKLPQSNGIVKDRTSNNSSLVGERLSPSKSSPSSNHANHAAAIQDGNGKPTCPTCMRQFSRPEQLTLHIRIHSFERVFRCEPCRISFRTQGHLQKHTRSLSHTNKLNMNITFGRPSMDNPRPFKCVDCKSAFRIHGHLAKHLRSKLHIMKLECLGKVPFGMYAEMERNDINFGSIDTTDCDRALETLQMLAQKLYDPRQKCWMENVDLEQIKNEQNILNNNHKIKDLNEHQNNSPNIADEDSDSAQMIEDETIEILEEDDCSSSDGGQLSTTSVVQSESQDHHDDGELSKKVDSISPEPAATTSSSSNPTTLTTSQQALTTGTTIVSTRSNTCHICGRLFKGAKFLQVHLYCEHPDWNETTNTTATTTTTTSATISNSTLATSA